MKAADAIATLEEFVRRINAHDPKNMFRFALPSTSLSTAWVRSYGAERDWSKLGPAIFRCSRTTASTSRLQRHMTRLYSPAGSHLLLTRHRKNRGAFPPHGGALVRDGRIAEWQVYADNKPVYELLSE
jgi:hypothetical protein